MWLEIGFSFYFVFHWKYKITCKKYISVIWISFLNRDKRLGQNQTNKWTNKSPILSLMPQEDRLWPISKFSSEKPVTEYQCFGGTDERQLTWNREFVCLFVFSCRNMLFNSPIILHAFKNISSDSTVVQTHFSSICVQNQLHYLVSIQGLRRCLSFNQSGTHYQCPNFITANTEVWDIASV